MLSIALQNEASRAGSAQSIRHVNQQIRHAYSIYQPVRSSMMMNPRAASARFSESAEEDVDQRTGPLRYGGAGEEPLDDWPHLGWPSDIQVLERYS